MAFQKIHHFTPSRSKVGWAATVGLHVDTPFLGGFLNSKPVAPKKRPQLGGGGGGAVATRNVIVDPGIY